MRLSHLFSPTLRRAPAEAVEASHQLLLRTGLARSLGSGSWSLLPLGQQVRRRIEQIGRGALTAAGGQEMSLPPLVPPDPWQEAGQRSVEGLSLRDKAGRPFVLAHTLEPLLTVLLRPDLRSHRVLPLLLYGLRPRFRQEPAAGSGPLAARQGLLLEAFSLQPDAASREAALEVLQRVCGEILDRSGLKALAAEAALDPEGSPAYEFVVPQVPGGEGFARCPGCGYLANRRVARRAKQPPLAEDPLSLEDVLTPDCHTIAEVAAFLGVPESRTAKAVFLMAEDRFLFVVVRGDMDVHEDKLAHHAGARELRPAMEHEILALGASPGYASPIGIRRSAPEAGIREVRIVVDDLVPHCPNLVAGANKENYHTRNVNYGRDYSADIVADLVAVQAGDPCPHCLAALEVFPSTVLARVWAPGTRYSEALGASFQDEAGREHLLQLVCAEIEVDRALAACAEVHHDEHGLLWPPALAPYAVHLLTIGDEPEVMEAATSLYASLQAAGVSVLFDDRAQSAGSKFVEADLLGMPLRVAVGPRTVAAEGAEVRRRDLPRETVQVVPLRDVVDWVREELAALEE